MTASSTLARLQESLDKTHALALLRRAIATPSVTGEEAAFAAMMKDELVSIGAEGIALREFAPGRPNVWGLRKGRPGAGTLLMVGHTDTVHVRGWKEHWARTEREDPFGGALVDGAVWGRGASDLKAGLCTAIEAVHTLDRAGVPLDRTLLFAFVGDEESGEPGNGVSAGARAFADVIRGGEAPKPDMAIYVEPTMLDVYVAHMGFFLCDIKVIGKSAYFGVPELGVDALKAARSRRFGATRTNSAQAGSTPSSARDSSFRLEFWAAATSRCRASAQSASSPKYLPEWSSIAFATASKRRRAPRSRIVASAWSFPIPRAAIIRWAARRSKARRTRRISPASFPLFERYARIEGSSRRRHTGRSFRSSPRLEFPASISRQAISGSATPRKRTSRSRTITTVSLRSPSSSPALPRRRRIPKRGLTEIRSPGFIARKDDVVSRLLNHSTDRRLAEQG